ncbi:large ribosomal subunit protein mL40 [Diachasmimorpha longicaudata]|uniref:large ribosomal subunit protein mL40 n=1 Tax=Diachasmimorpha longicaudata TaxID=58733 RepID=UPI0030B90646
MSFSGILSAFSRLSVHALRPNTRNISTNINPLCFKATEILYGEPLKKKRRIDPAVVRQREMRKQRKIEKAIRRLEKHARQLKPVSEVEPAFKLVDDMKRRTRPKPKLSDEVIEDRILLLKEWTRYKQHEHLTDIQMIDTAVLSQQKALDELRSESEELYQAAIQLDLSFLPHNVQGPVSTPPIRGYNTPDGEYIDITKKYDGEDQFVEEPESS